MAVCFFNNDYDTKYRCEYEVKDKGIEVNVEYDIIDEIESVNGVKTFGKDTTFEDRDILIYDYKSKKSYLLKDAGLVGFSSVSSIADDISSARFYSDTYIYHSNLDKLTKLSNPLRIRKIKVFTNLINDLIGKPSFSRKSSKDSFLIELNKNTKDQIININSNNIRNIYIGDDWIENGNGYNLNIDFNGHIELELCRRINYDEVFKYIRELMIYIELYRPSKLFINKIYIYVDDDYYGFSIDINQIKTNKYYIKNSVSDNILDFLKRCYSYMPYRNSKDIRELYYIILDKSHNIEDNFLCFYRMIECYYKRQNINNFIKYSITNNYKKVNEIEDVDKISAEIIALRNNYVHSGYYIKKKSLQIKMDDSSKNYTVSDINIDWIYDRTKILYDIVIDIVFSRMLLYKDYKYEKNF